MASYIEPRLGGQNKAHKHTGNQHPKNVLRFKRDHATRINPSFTQSPMRTCKHVDRFILGLQASFKLLLLARLRMLLSVKTSSYHKLAEKHKPLLLCCNIFGAFIYSRAINAEGFITKTINGVAAHPHTGSQSRRLIYENVAP